LRTKRFSPTSLLSLGKEEEEEEEKKRERKASKRDEERRPLGFHSINHRAVSAATRVATRSMHVGRHMANWVREKYATATEIYSSVRKRSDCSAEPLAIRAFSEHDDEERSLAPKDPAR